MFSSIEPEINIGLNDAAGPWIVEYQSIELLKFHLALPFDQQFNNVCTRRQIHIQTASINQTERCKTNKDSAETTCLFDALRYIAADKTRRTCHSL